MEITKEIIHQTVLALDPNLETTAEEFTVGTILLAALHTGANVKKIASFLELPVESVTKYEKALRQNKIWVGRKTHQEWTPDLRGQMAFWLDVLVAMGRAKKTIQKRL
jgi:hypothetical protein